MDEKKNLINYYNEFSKRQQKVGVNERHYSILNKCLKNGLSPSSEVLEIGCGIGTFTSLLIDVVKKGEITSIDISDKSIDIAKNTYTEKNVDFISGNAVTYDFGNQKFDYIILPDVLEHIPFEEHHKLFQKISQLIKKDGKIIIHIPNPYHSDYWRALGRPMQYIDLSVHLPVIIDNLKQTGLFISFLEIYSVWLKEGEYQFIILEKESKFNEFSDIESKTSFIDKIKQKIKFEINKRTK